MTPPSVRPGPKVAASIMFATVILTIAGCFPFDRYPTADETIPHNAATGGQTLREMQTRVARIPGLLFDQADGGGPPNIKGYTGYEFAITVQPGYRIVDGPKLVTYLVESAWSVREGYLPNAQIAIRVAAGEGSSFDIAEAAAEAGWIEPRSPEPRESGYTYMPVVTYEDSPARERLGNWPGSVPPLPTGITERIPDTEKGPPRRLERG